MEMVAFVENARTVEMIKLNERIKVSSVKTDHPRCGICVS